MLPKKRYKQLKEDALTIDYSGWALVTHKWLPNSVAYAAIETIDERKKIIPVDDDRPINMSKLCKARKNVRCACRSIPGRRNIIGKRDI